KFVILSNSYYKYNNGGTEIQCKYIADFFIKKKYEVYYIFLHDQDLSYNDHEIHLHGIKKESSLRLKLFGKIIYYNKVLKLLDSINPDIIYHRNLSNFALPVLNYSISKNIKTILHLAHIMDVEKINIFNKHIVHNLINKMGKKKLLMNFMYIIGQTKYQDELLSKNFNRECDLIIPNFHPYTKENISKSNKIKILWIANLKDWKQPKKFIQLAEECKYTNAEFIMIGKNPKNEWSKGLEKRISEIKNLSYLGELPIKRVNEFLAESHILVNTSLYEGFPNTFIQAWMRKVPVVSLNVDPDDVLKQNEIGYHSISFDKMINDVKFLISNNKLRDEMGEKAQKYAFKNHSLKNIGKLIGLIEDEKNNI
ncbi:MAG: glycosyltransferase family 4 protein, partial [Candidatus Marinimicrobia bacterium]|nr:glycosyltransferase family 4 protein [Candidatus Neomarinimicrobiota bacterium]